MIASETRRLAREALSGKWGKAALTMLVYTLITGVIRFILKFIPIVGPIAELVIRIPLTYGLIATLIKIKRGKDTTYIEFFTTGFSNFVNSWKVSLWACLKLIVPIILVIASIAVIALAYGPWIFNSSTHVNNVVIATKGANPIVAVLGFIALIASSIWLFVESYSYKPIFFMLFDNHDMSAKEIVEESYDIMYGNKWQWFCLEFSFIGWAILAFLTCGIGYLWLVPYMIVAEVVFYEFLIEGDEEAEENSEKD